MTPPRFTDRQTGSPLIMIPALPLNFPPRLTPHNGSSSVLRDYGLASTFGVEDEARRGSQTAAIAGIVETLGLTHINDIPKVEAQTAVAAAQALHNSSTPPSATAHTRNCRWSETCTVDLSDSLSYAAMGHHLSDFHGIISTRRDGRKSCVKCLWPGCTASFQAGSAGRHVLDIHVDPSGKAGRR